jgi:hypothetical protein
VLVGVNRYSPCKPGEAASANDAKIPGVAPGRSHCNDWVDLDGSLNDVQAMRQVLQARYGFKKENMHVLSTPLVPGVSEREATRQNILDAINKYLIQEAKPGDIVVFYYAGHGSQVGNSKSREAASAGGKGRDETIVPADANRGVWDIRDKEFSRLFNKIADRQATLTAIFDSCHSGSIARGAVVPHKSRHIADEDRDAKDDYNETPPENRGALIFSAALSSEEAMEVEEREPNQKASTPHGAFTLALLKVLRTAPVNLSAQDIALMVKTQLDAEDIRQLPNLNGTDDRKKKPLFGTDSGSLSGFTRVPVADVDNETVTLDGGWALGLNAGCELHKVTDDKNAPPIRIQISEVNSLTKSAAKTLTGNIESINPGDLFELDKWVPQPGARLRVWIANPGLSREKILRAAQNASQFARSGNLQWIDDPTDPAVANLTQVYWNGAQWALANAAAPSQMLGSSLDGKLTLASFGHESKGKSQLFLSVPPTTELAKALDFGSNATGRAIEVTSSREDADYLLVGRVRNGNLEYAWVLPNATQELAAETPLPIRSDWFTVGDSKDSLSTAATKLQEALQPISRLRGWLNLPSPPDSGKFPYRLALKRSDCAEECKNYIVKGPVVEDDKYGIVLVADPKDLKPYLPLRWVYVFVIDSWGHSTLLFPPPTAGNEAKLNHLPMKVEDQWPQEIAISDPDYISISTPLGVDTYVLLTTETPISDLSVFSFEGARTHIGERAGARGAANPLEDLIADVNGNARGAGTKNAVPATWSIQRLSIQSVAKTANAASPAPTNP